MKKQQQEQHVLALCTIDKQHTTVTGTIHHQQWTAVKSLSHGWFSEATVVAAPKSFESTSMTWRRTKNKTKNGASNIYRTDASV